MTVKACQQELKAAGPVASAENTHTHTYRDRERQRDTKRQTHIHRDELFSILFTQDSSLGKEVVHYLGESSFFNYINQDNYLQACSGATCI